MYPGLEDYGCAVEEKPKKKSAEVVKAVLDELVKRGPLHGAWWNLKPKQREKLKERCRKLVEDILGE